MSSIKSVSFALDLTEDVVGDVTFSDKKGSRAQIQSNAKPITPSPITPMHPIKPITPITPLNPITPVISITRSDSKDLAKTWNLSKTGSFEKGGFKIKNGITESPSQIKNIDRLNDENKNMLKSVDELDFMDNIGSGAVGTVKKATLKKTGEILAIKCIDFFDQNSRKQFMDEISLYITLSHPYIVPFKGCCINHHTEQLYLALEYCENGSLHSYIKKHGPFTEILCQRLSMAIISALAYLESNRFIHRDIKPQNILLDKDFTAKLADFGIQKSLVKTFAKTQVGTMIYMSPERLKGENYSYNSDIWSFGLTLLYCVLGYFPYNKENKRMGMLEMHIVIVEEETPKLPEVDKNGDKFSMEFRSFVQACLYKDHNKRWKASDLLMHPFLAVSTGLKF